MVKLEYNACHCKGDMCNNTIHLLQMQCVKIGITCCWVLLTTKSCTLCPTPSAFPSLEIYAPVEKEFLQVLIELC